MIINDSVPRVFDKIMSSLVVVVRTSHPDEKDNTE